MHILRECGAREGCRHDAQMPVAANISLPDRQLLQPGTFLPQKYIILMCFESRCFTCLPVAVWSRTGVTAFNFQCQADLRNQVREKKQMQATRQKEAAAEQEEKSGTNMHVLRQRRRHSG
jgi:hypothetical protein